MRFYQASSWLFLVVLLGIVGCGGSDKGKDGAGDGSNAGTTSGKANTELQNQNLQSSNTPKSSATPDPANPKTTKSEPQIEKKATDKHVTPPNPTAPSPTSSIVVRHLKSESATVVYRFGGDPTEKVWTGPTGLSFMPDSKRLCVFGDSPFNAIISIPDKARLSSPNPSFDNRFEVTKISGYEWSPAIAANHLVDNLPLHDAAATLRHNLHNSWRTLGWHTCDVSKNGTYVAIGDRHKGRLEVVRVSDGKTVVSFDSSQYRPKPTDDRSTFGGGGSHTDNLQYAFSPDETKVALAVRTNSTPPRAFLAILETNSGALLQKIENFCPITMVFSPDSRTLATYYGRHSDYRSGGNPIDKGASKPGCIIRLLSTDDFTKQTDLVVEGSAQPVAFSKDGSILIAWDQGSGEDSASSSLLRAFDVGIGSQLWHQDLPQTLASHVYVHDDTRLFAGGFRRNKKNNSTCRVYCLDLRNGSPTLILEDAELWLYAVAPDGKTIATSSGRSQIKAWPIDAGEAVTTTKMATPTPKTPVIVGVEKPTTQEPKPTGVAVPPVSKDSPAIGTDVPPNVALAQESTPKPAVPDDAAQKAALAVVADVYKPDYEKAKTAVQKIELAKKLLGEGIATKDDSASRFVLFRIARDIAAQQGDLVTAFDAIDRITAEYEADRMQMQVAAATTATKALKLPKDHQACAALLAPLIDEAVAVDRYDHAKSLAALTLGCAREGRDSALIKQMVAELKEVEEVAAEFEKVKVAKVALEAKPTDPDANFAVGKFLCLVKGDWKRGVTMLALGSNEEFKATALLELEATPDALKLGDGWWKISDGLDGSAKLQAQAHAAGWYRNALPGLSGLSKTRVERLVSQVPPTLVPKAVKDVKGEVEDTQSKSGLKDGRFDILWDGGWRFLLEVKGDAVLFYGEVNPENKFIPWVKPVSIPFKLDATNNLASADNHGRDNFHFAFQWNYATKEASRNNPATKKLEKGKVVSPLVGRWVQSNGWAIELLENGEATNTNPNGGVEATGKWQDNGNGKYSIRLGPKSEWLWNMTLQGNTLNTEMFLNGASMSKGTFARQREQGTNILRNTVLNPSQKAWTFDKSGLEAANLSDSSSFVSIPIDAARSYDLQMSVILKQAKGKNDIHIVFPFRGVMRPFVIRHDDNGNVTLSFWPKEPKLLGTPPYGVTLPSTTAFESNKARLITLKVRTDSTEVLLDGTVIFRLAGDATVTDKSEPVSLRLGSWNNRVLFQSVTVVEKKER